MAAACPSAEQNVLDRLKRRGSRDPFKCSVVVKKVSISGLPLPVPLPTRAAQFNIASTTPQSDSPLSSPPSTSIQDFLRPSLRTNLSLHIPSPASSDIVTSPSSLPDFLSHDDRQSEEQPSNLSCRIMKFLQEDDELCSVDDNDFIILSENEVVADDIDEMYILDDSEVEILNNRPSHSTHKNVDEEHWAITSSSCTSTDDLVAPLRLTLAKKRSTPSSDSISTKKRQKNNHHQLNRRVLSANSSTTTVTTSDSDEDVDFRASRRRPTLIASSQNKKRGFKAVKQRVTFNLPDEHGSSSSCLSAVTFVQSRENKRKGRASSSSSDELQLVGSTSSSTLQWATDPTTQEKREVAAITSHTSSKFLLMWADDRFCSSYWVPRSDVHCQRLLKEYFSKRSSVFETPESHSNMPLVNSVPDSGAGVNRTFVNGASISSDNRPQGSGTRRVQFSDESTSSSRQLLLTSNSSSLLKNHLSSSRLDYKKQLRKWEKQINKKIDGKEPRIHIENTVDQSPIPSNFTYVCKSNMVNCNIEIDVAATPGCNCSGACFRSSECCPHRMNTEVAYNQRGYIKIPPGYPIYECNASCFCDPTCFNRVVQRGRQVPLCVFRTSNGRGWGVKTMQTLSKGQFVSEYIGEIISNEEAEKRGKKYDQTGSTYLFDLDFDKDDAAFTIDATNCGNISHFLNHSCDPNLQVYSVWIETLDARLPHLALFAKKKIIAGEELTFDYQMGHNGEHLKHKGRIQCLCGSQNCNRYLF